MYQELVGLKGGENETFWQVVGVSEPHSTKYWPGVDEEGREKSWADYPDLDSYLQAKQERRRVTVSLTMAGNPISAEEEIRQQTGKNCLAVGPHTLQIYVVEDGPNE
jgi:hypothetical protein